MAWDSIVVGAGSAGCALARELVESGRKVLVLEAGGSDRSPFIKVPAGVTQAYTRFDWGYQALPDPSRHGKREKWLRGRVLGGSSSVNGTKYVRAPGSDFDRWSALCGNVGGWSASEVLPIYGELEHSDQQGLYRGQKGPLSVRTVREPAAITRAFVEATRAAGYAYHEDYNNAITQEGVGYAQLTQRRRGLRCSAADAFLRPLLARDNLELRLNTLVEKVEIANGRAEAVRFRQKGELVRETAKEIILCGGAINSPQLLMLSGIGDPHELRRHGIAPIVELPGVGRNFQDQPLVRLACRVNVPTYNLTEGLFQKLGIAAKFLFRGEGPISNLFESVAIIRSSGDQPAPDVRLAFLPVGYSTEGDGDFRVSLLPDLLPYPSFMISVIKSYPVGTGRITLASADPGERALIDYPLFAEQADVDTMVDAIEAVRHILRQPPMGSLVEEELTPGDGLQGREALESFVRTFGTISQHPLGSCRMGIGDGAVVDPELGVRGVENLWVADASIMPTNISADLNATCMLIGAKLGRQLARR